MERTITGFDTDDEGHWVAVLDCGHPQHTRHDPPLVDRDWVLTEAGRASRLGRTLNCVRCDDHEFPDGLEPHSSTEVFTESTVPAGLRRRHRTKSGVWARVEVLEGELEFTEHEPFDTTVTLSPSRSGVVVPEVPHEVACGGPVRFRIHFMRVSDSRPASG